MAPDLQSLVTLGQRVLRAQDMRGEWRPIRKCADQLQRAGTSPAIALATAQAMATVARELRERKA